MTLIDQGTTGTFNATGPKARLAWEDLLETCRKAVPDAATLTWVPGEWIKREADEVFPIWAPYLGETRGSQTWQNRRAVKAGLTFRPPAETVADTLRWYRGQPEGGRTKLAGPTAAKEAELLAKWKGSRG